MKKLSLNKITVAKLSNKQLSLIIAGSNRGGDRSDPQDTDPLCKSDDAIALLDQIYDFR